MRFLGAFLATTVVSRTFKRCRSVNASIFAHLRMGCGHFLHRTREVRNYERLKFPNPRSTAESSGNLSKDGKEANSYVAVPRLERLRSSVERKPHKGDQRFQNVGRL